MAHAAAPVNFDGFTYVAPSAVKLPRDAEDIADVEDTAVESDWCDVSAEAAAVDDDVDVG